MKLVESNILNINIFKKKLNDEDITRTVNWSGGGDNLILQSSVTALWSES